MSDLQEGDYNLQNIEFLVVLGETTRKTTASEAQAHETPSESQMAGLPRQIAVSPTGFEPPTVSHRIYGGILVCSRWLIDTACFWSVPRETARLRRAVCDQLRRQGRDVPHEWEDLLAREAELCVDASATPGHWPIRLLVSCSVSSFWSDCAISSAYSLRIANGQQQWYLTDDADYTPVCAKSPAAVRVLICSLRQVTIKVPQKSDKPNVFMWNFSPV